MYGSESNDYRMSIGHYTAMLWAETHLVGCAAVEWYLAKDKSKYKALYVCNYGPAGNVMGLPIYLEGKERICFGHKLASSLI